MAHFFKLLEKKTNLKLLLYFLSNPTKETYAAAIEREIKLSKKSILDAITALESAGLLLKKPVGKMMMYSLKNDLVIVKQLKILSAISELIRLSSVFEGVRCEVYLFGSTARGENTEQSDIDILILSEVEKSELIGLLAKARIKNLKPQIYSHLEYATLSKRDNTFYERIEKDRIKLV